MPVDLISASVLIFEKVLTEKDEVLSAVRIVEVFYFTPIPDVPLNRQTIQMSILATARAAPSEDDSQHSIELNLIRPDGTVKALGPPVPVGFKAKMSTVPGGFGLVAPMGVVPSQMGTHYISLLLDGKEIARTPFTLLERAAEPAQ